MKNLVLVTVAIVSAFFLAQVLIPWILVIGSGKSLGMIVKDTAMINGIITASAVVYAFTLTGVAKYRGWTGLVLDILLGVSTLLMLYTGGFYFDNYVKYGYATLSVLTWAATSLFWNFGMWFVVVTIKLFVEHWQPENGLRHE